VSVAFVLLLTGPAGAGKTAAAERWAATRPYPAAHVSLDNVRDFVRSGYADPQDGWNEETQRQYELARDLCAELARRYVAAGVACVVDDAIFPEWPAVGYEGWEQALAGVPHTLVVLFADLPVLLERNERGHEGDRRLRRDIVEMIYRDMLPWRAAGVPVVATDALSVDETVAEIDRLVAGVEVGVG
jgi:hypothetical protein